MMWRKRRLSGVFVRASAPGKATVLMPIETLIGQVLRDARNLTYMHYPAWDMFWPPPEEGEWHLELGYDARRR